MGDAHVGPHFRHQGAQRFQVGRAALHVDVHAVEIIVNHHYLGAQAAQRLRAGERAGTMAGVQCDLHALEGNALRLDAAHRMVDVNLAALLHRDGEAQIVAGGHGGLFARRHLALHHGLQAAGSDELLDAVFQLVRQLKALGVEQFDAVVLGRVMGGRNDGAASRPQFAHQKRHAGRRNHAGQKRGAAGAGDAGHQGRFQHVAGKAGVLAHHKGLAQKHHGRLPQAIGQRRRQLGVRHTAYAVGSKQSCHFRPLSQFLPVSTRTSVRSFS